MPSAPVLSLSASDLARLQTALATALAPLDYERIEDWGAALMAAWRPLLAADQAFFAHSLGGTLTVQGDGARTAEAARAYAEHFWRVDPGVTERRKQLGLEVYHRDDVYERATFPKTELSADWCVPHRLCDIIALNVELGESFPAALHFYHDDEDRRPFGTRGLALLRLLLPAFKAGIQTSTRLAVAHAKLATVIDQVPDGLALFAADGRSLHRNPAFEATLAAEPERGRLMHAVQDAARHASALTRAHERPRRGTARGRLAWENAASGDGTPISLAASLFKDVRTASGRYRISTTRLGPVAAPSRDRGDPLILISLVRLGGRQRSDADLRSEYGMTKRELEVARLLALGHRTRAVADALGISVHTARHHTERVLRKLRITSRAAVAATLHDGNGSAGLRTPER